jgi:glycerol-3-phosphate dehydrogenase (NAD(P)+)
VVTILGAGVMGSAMCLPLRDRGHKVRHAAQPGDHRQRESHGLASQARRNPSRWRTAFQHEDLAAALGRDTGLVLLDISSPGVAWAIDRHRGDRRMRRRATETSPMPLPQQRFQWPGQVLLL